MSLSHSPKIITNELVLALDAANPKSYPGSGTTWTDLSSNQLNATLSNGPTYSSLNKGYISFDGSNDFASIVDNSLLNPSQSMTTSAWVYINSFVVNASIFGKGSGSGGYDFRIDNSTQINLVKYNVIDQRITISSLSTGTWYNICAVQGSTSVVYYINGVNVGSFSNSSAFASQTSEFRIARNRDTVYSNIRIGQILFYNSQLSATQVLQNFNALRGRYAI